MNKIEKKKMFRNNKGFSMVELMVGLLIIAVISAAALAMLGGVLNTGKVKADKESAETIRRAVQAYINATGDTNLSMIGGTGLTVDDLITRLSGQVITTKPTDTTGTTHVRTYDKTNHRLVSGTGTEITSSCTYQTQDEPGTFGPFLDGEQKIAAPQQNGMSGWTITVNPEIGQVHIIPTATDSITIS